MSDYHLIKTFFQFQLMCAHIYILRESGANIEQCPLRLVILQ